MRILITRMIGLLEIDIFSRFIIVHNREVCPGGCIWDPHFVEGHVVGVSDGRKSDGVFL